MTGPQSGEALLDAAASLLSGAVLVVGAGGQIQRVLDRPAAGPFESETTLDGKSLDDLLSLPAVVHDSTSNPETTAETTPAAVVEATLAAGDERTIRCVSTADRQAVVCQLRPLDHTDGVLLAATAAAESESVTQDAPLLDSVLAVVPVGIVCVDLSGEMSVVNERAASILGSESSELVGSSFADIEAEFVREDGTNVSIEDNPVRRTIESGAPLDGLGYWVERPDTDRRWLSVRTTPIRRDGVVRRVVLGFEDTTDLKQRDQHLQWLVENAEFAGIGGWELDLETDTVTGTGTLGLYRTDRSDQYESTLEEALQNYHPNDRGAVREAVASCRDSGGSMEVEARRKTAAGQTRWVRLRARHSDETGSAGRIQGIIRDITLSKEREQRLRVMNRILRHNIRNKLTVVNGNARLIESRLNELDSPEESLADNEQSSTSDTGSLAAVEAIDAESLRSRAVAVQDASDQLYEIAEEVRQYHEAVNQGVEETVVDVAAVVSDVREQHLRSHPTATIHTEGLDDVVVSGSRRLVRHVFDTLVENALKHNDSSDPVVSIEGNSDHADLAVRVADNGPGMPAVEREMVNSEKETPIAHSTGIGLWSVKWMIRRLGGNITAAPRNSTGTIVEATFPRPSTQ